MYKEQNKSQLSVRHKILTIFILIYVSLAIYTFSIPITDLESFGAILFVNIPFGLVLTLISLFVLVKNLNATKLQRIVPTVGIIIGLLIPFLSIIRFLTKTE